MEANYWMTKPDHRIPLDNSIGSIRLGYGVDLSSPDDPVLRSLIPFETATGSLNKSLRENETHYDSNLSSAQIIETTSDYEEAKVLSAYFKGSFSIGDFAAAMSIASHRRKSERSCYVIIESKGHDDTLIANELKWKSMPSSESDTVSDPDRLRQFLQTYGSHYVTGLKYAYRVAIRAALQTLDESKRQEFSAAFSAWGVKAGGDHTYEEKLRTMNVQFRAEVFASAILPKEHEGKWIMTSFDDIKSFLDLMRNGALSFRSAPIQATLASYWPTLTPYPKTRQVLTRQDGHLAVAPYGVPRGTIVAWWPTSDHIVEVPGADGSLIRKAIPPVGWQICDGSPGTPALSNSFMRGADSLTALGTIGGSESHNHGGLTVGDALHGTAGWVPTGTRNVPVATGWQHYHNIDVSSHLPPYVSVMFIMKM